MSVPDLDSVLALAGETPGPPQWRRQDYERALLAAPEASFGRIALVAHCNGIFAGFAVANFLPAEKLAELETIVVHHNFRRRGIGAGLLIYAKDSTYRLGAAVMRLEVRESNMAAIALYLGHGFQKIGRRRSYYSAPPEDALVLQAALIAFAGRPLL